MEMEEVGNREYLFAVWGRTAGRLSEIGSFKVLGEERSERSKVKSWRKTCLCLMVFKMDRCEMGMAG